MVVVSAQLHRQAFSGGRRASLISKNYFNYDRGSDRLTGHLTEEN